MLTVDSQVKCKVYYKEAAVCNAQKVTKKHQCHLRLTVSTSRPQTLEFLDIHLAHNCPTGCSCSFFQEPICLSGTVPTDGLRGCFIKYQLRFSSTRIVPLLQIIPILKWHSPGDNPNSCLPARDQNQLRSEIMCQRNSFWKPTFSICIWSPTSLLEIQQTN